MQHSKNGIHRIRGIRVFRAKSGKAFPMSIFDRIAEFYTNLRPGLPLD
jgi:hypothetical protein